MSYVVNAPPPPRPTPRSRTFTREVWAERLARFPDSGLPPAQFCALEAVSLPSFYAWRRRLPAEALSRRQKSTSRTVGNATARNASSSALFRYRHYTRAGSIARVTGRLFSEKISLRRKAIAPARPGSR
jgi:hypothetical protein